MSASNRWLFERAHLPGCPGEDLVTELGPAPAWARCCRGCGAPIIVYVGHGAVTDTVPAALRDWVLTLLTRIPAPEGT